MASKVAVIALWLTCPMQVVAQGWASPLDARRVEVGIVDQWIRRTIRYDDGSSVQEGGWNRLAAFLRLTLTDDLGVDVSGLAWHRGGTHLFPSRDYFDFSFGAGITYRPIHVGTLDLGLNLHFHDLAYLDQSAERYSKRTSQLAISVGLSRRFPVLGQQVDLWAAPAYIIDRLTQYPPSGIPSHGSSLHNVGAIAGGRILAAQRLRIYSQVTYAESWQLEAGLSVVF